jgi:hypothetical protein
MAHDKPQPISMDDLDRLQINSAHELFWDGQRIEIRKSLHLSLFQKIVTIFVTGAAVLGGFSTALNSGSQFACREWLVWCGQPDQGTGALTSPVPKIAPPPNLAKAGTSLVTPAAPAK